MRMVSAPCRSRAALRQTNWCSPHMAVRRDVVISTLALLSGSCGHPPVSRSCPGARVATPGTESMGGELSGFRGPTPRRRDPPATSAPAAEGDLREGREPHRGIRALLLPGVGAVAPGSPGSCERGCRPAARSADRRGGSPAVRPSSVDSGTTFWAQTPCTSAGRSGAHAGVIGARGFAAITSGAYIGGTGCSAASSCCVGQAAWGVLTAGRCRR